jgi:hypothetical protein
MSAVAAAGGGFLLAVLWFDLMFDVQVAGNRGELLPEQVLASIAGYYARVTTAARPMNRLVAAVMVLTLAALVTELAKGGHTAAALVSLALAAVAIGLAGTRVVPRAVRLGTRRDDAARQSALARSIFRDHCVCAACIAAMLAVQLTAG